MNIEGRETEIFKRALDEMGIKLTKDKDGYSVYDVPLCITRQSRPTTPLQVVNALDAHIYDYYIQPLNEQFEDRRDLFDEITNFCVSECLDDWGYGDWVLVFGELDEITRKNEVRELLDKFEPTIEVLAVIAHRLDDVCLDDVCEPTKERVGAYGRDCS